MAKRIFALMLACAMVFAVIPGASAADGEYFSEVQLITPNGSRGIPDPNTPETGVFSLGLSIPAEVDASALIQRALACPTCSSIWLTREYHHTEVDEIGGTAAYCRSITIFYYLYCENGHLAAVDAYSQTGAHSYVADSNGYTRTCIHCGHIDRN